MQANVGLRNIDLLTVERRSGSASAVSAIELPQLQTTDNASEYVLTSKDNAPEWRGDLERLRGSGHRIAFGDAAYGVMIAGKSGNPATRDVPRGSRTSECVACHSVT